MFTGIIETIGEVKGITQQGSNKQFEIKSSISDQLKVDQSISHNGVCLTVVNVKDDHHFVTAISETLNKSTLNDLEIGSQVNLERCTKIGDRLDGHIVQGHVDEKTKCVSVDDLDGSFKFKFAIPENGQALLIPQGSISINGVSLTVSDLDEDTFSVAIIPYTFENTVFNTLTPGMEVNLEYDVIGKYVQRQTRHR
jgi:riboflavin synthase